MKKKRGSKKHYNDPYVDRDMGSRTQYLMVYLSFEEVKAAYGPGSSCKTMTDAIETFREDMIKEAEYQGFEGAALFAPTVSLYTTWITNLWRYDEAESLGSQDPDNDGRRDDSSELEERDDGAGSGEA